MPEIRKYRQWCIFCNNFEIHERKSIEDKNIYCSICETPHTEVLLSDIPEEKLKEQQERFKRRRSKYHFNKWAGFTAMTTNLFLPSNKEFEDVDLNIIESDAGLEAVEDYERQLAQKRKLFEISEKNKFKLAGRNDSCPCGSGNKYKKCCLDRIESYK